MCCMTPGSNPAYLRSPSLRPMASFSLDDTKDGELPPWEVAKAYAFKIMLDKSAETLEKPASELVGGPVADFIASQLTLKGGQG